MDTATVLFSDLVSSTEHRARLGEDGAEALRVVHDAIVRDAITSNRGVVVKHLGDGVMATFTSAASAVSGAITLQQSIDTANRRGELDAVQVRIGISVGDVTFEGDDCFGLPVVEAQRLEASAEPGTIRCAEVVRVLARGRGGHDYRDLGALELNGLPEPVAACEVQWVPLASITHTGPRELPPLVATSRALPFSGREEPLDVLVSAWKRVTAGGFEVVLLAGEPGVGKTRLASELAQRVGDARVLAGRCDEDVQAPFQPFAGALDWAVGHPTTSGSLAENMGRHPGDLVRLVPDLAQRVADLPPPLTGDLETERLRLFQAVTSWLSVDEENDPTLLVLDDLHWADRESLALLKHVLHERPTGLMIVGTYRDTDVDRVHALSSVLADLRRHDAVTRLPLDGLTADEIKELMVRTGGHDLDDKGLALAVVVHRETAGNPFFVGEVLRHLADTGALVERDGRWTSDLSPGDQVIPEGIREVVGRRLGRLGEPAENVLRAAAVIGHEFDVDLLIVVGADTEDGVLDAMDLAVAGNLLHELGVGTYRFAHALVRETLRSELSPTRRARQHRKVAQALEARHGENVGPVLDELANHWAEATIGGDQTRAIELAAQSAHVALTRGASDHAVLWSERALEMIDGDPSFASLERSIQVDLAHAEVWAEGRNPRPTMARAARSAIDAGDTVTAHAALTVAHRALADEGREADPILVTLLREALTMTPPLTTARRAEILSHLAQELIFVPDIPGRESVLVELLALLPDLDPIERGRTLFTFNGVEHHSTVANLESWVSSLRAALEVEVDPRWRTHNHVALAYFLMKLGDRSGADAAIRQLTRVAEASGHQGSYLIPMMRTMLAQAAGDFKAARAAADEAIAAIAFSSRSDAMVLAGATALGIGRESDMTSWLIEPWMAAGADQGPLTGINVGICYLRLRDGDAETARELLDTMDLAQINTGGEWSFVVGCLAEMAAKVGTTDQAQRLRALLAGHTGAMLLTGGIVLGAADRLLALLDERVGDDASADRLFASAVALHEQFESPPWIARTHLDWAAARLARGEVDLATNNLDAAEAAIGSLDLRESARRLGELRAQI